MYKNFLSVKIAELTVVDLLKDSLYDLVSKCLCLEELHLIRCKLPSSSLELNSPESNLKCLVLKNCCIYDCDRSFSHVSINIPTLLRFKYEGSSCYPSINNAENLIEAEIKLDYSEKNEHGLFFNLLKDLRNVKVLTLCFRYLEVVDTNGGRSLLPPLCNLKHLAITLLLAENALPSLMCLLRNSPCLETLSMNLQLNRYDLSEDVYNEVEAPILVPHILPSDCVMHLTKIEITNFQGLKVEMEFVKMMLQSSLCLKGMVICISSRYEHLKKKLGRLFDEIGDQTKKKMFDEILQKKRDAAVENLLACTCVSPDARILIK
ncbi:hypothetical protein MKW94_030244 [Papaver nudicaule]|uniref:At1g61320/AtMIF1 LRR domain-containing protein n=1 Tax=Papaver nudicaule TaxID=74823 RepID=A0AA41W039_PAPNU|nr:hypothetical protein [Papaver nudicaule]